MKIAGAITTFARPEYYKQAIQSLEKCHGVNDGIDWYVFQDGFKNLPIKKYPRYRDIKYSDILENIHITETSQLNIVNHYMDAENSGINFQMNRVFNLFQRGYDTIFIFEDDLVVSPYYISLLKNCSRKHRNIAVTFHSVNKGNIDIANSLNLLRPAKRPRFWGFYLTLEVWKKIKNDWHSFYSNGVRYPYYDPIITQAIRKRTGGKYESVISRSYNVGVDGTLTMNQNNWSKRLLDIQSDNYVFDSDATLKRFKLIS